MPELPEVETVKRVLIEKIKDLKIEDIELRYEPIFENKEEIINIINQRFIDIYRKGKYLFFILEKGVIMSHLRMEGKYFYTNSKDYNKHMHVIFHLDNGYSLIYQDVRKFGRMHYYNTLEDALADIKLGPDANEAIESLDILYERVKKSKKPLKTLLLEQDFVAGLGNIYVDEVCYYANLYPNILASQVTKKDLENILKGSKEILDKAIINKGTTIRSYTSELGVTGSYQNYLNVHTKEYDPNNNLVLKMKIGGRTTYFSAFSQAPRKRCVIGITGGIATGKSHVTNFIKSCGFKVIDSDLIVKEAYQDLAVVEKLKASFKEAILNNDLDRKIIAKLIFTDASRREELNKIIHPYVITRLKEEIKDNNGLLFLDIPLLYECNLAYLCDFVAVCSLELTEQINRLMIRDNIDYDYALKKINSQMPLEEKLKRANYIIDTSGSFKETDKKINDFIVNLFDDLCKE